MMTIRCGWRAVAAIGALLAAPAVARAQAWEYPEFQPPEVAVREFQGAIAGASDYGTSFFGQWREGIGSKTHLQFEFGLSTPSNADTRVNFGATINQSVLRSSQSTPIDILLTGGAFASLAGDFSILRIPLGAVVGHRFPMSNGMAITPYIHPRLSIDFCLSSCSPPELDDRVNIDFDLGGSLDLSKTMSIRAALMIGQVNRLSTKVAFGAGVAFRPGGNHPAAEPR